MTKNRRRKQDIREQMELSGNSYLQAAREIGSESTLFIPTGLPTLDSRLSGGIPVGELTTLMGAPGIGKSTFLRGLLGNAVGLKRRVALVTDRANALELPGLVVNRILTDYNYFHPAILKDVLEGVDDPRSLDLIVVDGPAFEQGIAAERIAELRSSLRALARALDVALVMTSKKPLESYGHTHEGTIPDRFLEVGYGKSHGSGSSRAIYPSSSSTGSESPVTVQLSPKGGFKEIRLSATSSRLKILSTGDEKVTFEAVEMREDGNLLLATLAELIIAGSVNVWEIPDALQLILKHMDGPHSPNRPPNVTELEYLIEKKRLESFYENSMRTSGEYATLQNSPELREMIQGWRRGEEVLPLNRRRTHLESLLAFHRESLTREQLLEDFLVQHHLLLGDRNTVSSAEASSYLSQKGRELETIDSYAKQGYLDESFLTEFKDLLSWSDTSIVKLSSEDRVFFVPYRLDSLSARVSLRIKSCRGDGAIEDSMVDGFKPELVARRDWFWSEDTATGLQELYRLDQDREIFDMDKNEVMDGVLILA